MCSFYQHVHLETKLSANYFIPKIGYSLIFALYSSFSSRPKSSLSRGRSRTPTSSVRAIQETDENPAEPQGETIPPTAEEKPAAPEEPPKVTEDALKEVNSILNT